MQRFCITTGPVYHRPLWEVHGNRGYTRVCNTKSPGEGHHGAAQIAPQEQPK